LEGAICDAEVPAAVPRCKVCFHDFTEEPPPRSSPLILLGAFAVMLLIGVAALAYVVMLPLEKKVLVDSATQSIVFVTQYRTGERTDRVDWARVGKLEHVTTANGRFEIIAVTLDGERHLIEQSSTTPLFGNAERYSQMMGRPLDAVDETRGFHRAAEAAGPASP
jgi:hypothetical protein